MTEAIQNASDAVENLPGFDIVNDTFNDVAEEYLQTKGKYPPLTQSSTRALQKSAVFYFEEDHTLPRCRRGRP